MGQLNHACGADYVKTTQSAPPVITLEPFQRVCSFDGDADRIVYYYSTEDTFRLMDGDKIATLVAGYVRDLIQGEDEQVRSRVRIGVVQTAYANGNSTRYIQKSIVSIHCQSSSPRLTFSEAIRTKLGHVWHRASRSPVLLQVSSTFIMLPKNTISGFTLKLTDTAPSSSHPLS